jgi:hypothetical protein
MSPAHRYQSRLFQTVRSQVHRLKDNVQLRWRQLKVAATWGAQIGLYPFYALFQAGRWSGQVLQQAAAQGKQAMFALVHGDEGLAADQPIQAVLNAIELFSLPIMGEDSSLNPMKIVLHPISRPQSIVTRLRKKIETLWQPWSKQRQTAFPVLNASASLECQQGLARQVAIQGIASSLAHRRMVLVTSDNHLLDVLTADQQHQLHQRIIWEITQVLYLRRQRSGARAIPAWKTWQALPIKVRPQFSFPVRLIYRLMGWVQQQPVAQALALPSGASLSLPPQSALASLQQWWATLRVSQTIAVAKVMRTPGVDSGCAAQRSPLALPSRPAPLSILAPFQQKLRTYRTILVAMVGALALLPFTLTLPEPANAAMAPALPSPLPAPILVERLMDPSRSRRRWQAEAALSEQLGKPSQGKVRIAPQKSTASLSAQGFEGAIANWASRFSQATFSENGFTIEVDAVFMGYDHNPLEVLLLWLDRAIAWIEVQFIKIRDRFRPSAQAWIQRYWPRRFKKRPESEF